MISLYLNQVLLTAIAAVVFATSARATDEIQVYNGRIAAPGQFTIQQHLNFVGAGQRQPEFPGGLISDRSLNGTPEIAYGVTNWWEVGLYLPFAVESGGQFHSNAFKLRTLFVSSNAEDRDFFYGVNFEFSHTTPRFAETKFGLEIRPILGFRRGDYEFIVNPIVGIGIGKNGEANFTPAARVAQRIEPNLFLGVEYYADLGEIGNFAPLAEQKHTLFAVSDFKLGIFDVNFGVGYGLTTASDRFVVKTIVGYAFPVTGQSAVASERNPPFSALKNPVTRIKTSY